MHKRARFDTENELQNSRDQFDQLSNNESSLGMHSGSPCLHRFYYLTNGVMLLSSFALIAGCIVMSVELEDWYDYKIMLKPIAVGLVITSGVSLKIENTMCKLKALLVVYSILFLGLLFSTILILFSINDREKI